MEELSRIPRVATYEQFKAFVEAGQKLAKLLVHFEGVKPYDGVTIDFAQSVQPSYRVRQMKWGRLPEQNGNAAKNKSVWIHNDWIMVRNIPLVVNKKSALDWVVEHACDSIDKSSGSVNNFNDYVTEVGNERYLLDLLLKIIAVGLETMKIVKSFLPLRIHPIDQQ